MNDVQDLKFKRTMFFPVLPLVYDDALSYIEQLGRITKKINEVIDSMSSLETDILSEAKNYTDLQIDTRLKDVDAVITEVEQMMVQLESDYTSFIRNVNESLEEMSTEIDGFNDNLVASVNAVNERTDAVVQANNEMLLREMQRYLANILVVNYITGEEMSVQDMFDFLCLYHVTGAITYNGLALKENTYSQLVAYDMTYTDLVTNGANIIQ